MHIRKLREMFQVTISATNSAEVKGVPLVQVNLGKKAFNIAAAIDSHVVSDVQNYNEIKRTFALDLNRVTHDELSSEFG